MTVERPEPFRFPWPELPWAPWSELFSRLTWPEELVTGMRSLRERGVWEHPVRVEEYTEGDTLVIRAELPGLDPDKDVEISVAEGVLHLRAERREEKKEETRAGYRSEFRYGAFRRTVALPAKVSEQDIDASYRDGILEVRVPLGGKQPPAKKILIRRG